MDIIAIIVAGVASMIAGWAWYSPFLFGKPWMAGNTHSSQEMGAVKQNGMGKLFIISAVLELVKAFVIYKVFELTGTTGFLGGAELVLFLWLGFMVPLEIGRLVWNGKSWTIFFIAASEDAVKLLAIAGVFALLVK